MEKLAGAISKWWKIQHPLNPGFIRPHSPFTADCGPAGGDPLPGMLPSDPWVAGLSWPASEFFFSKGSTGNTNVEWPVLKWILIVGTIFSFEAFRLWKFSSYPIWEGKKKKKPCKLISAWVEMCEARTNNSKSFESPLLLLLLCGVCWLVIWSWTHTAPAGE